MRKTNVEFITDAMEHSRHGALIQAFVICAIEKYARMVLEADGLDEQMKCSMVSPAAWRGCAKELTEKLDEHLGRETDGKDFNG